MYLLMFVFFTGNQQKYTCIRNRDRGFIERIFNDAKVTYIQYSISHGKRRYKKEAP